MLISQEDYTADATVIPTSTKEGNSWQQVNSFVMNCYEAFSQGFPARELPCLKENTIISHILMVHPK